MKLTYLVVVGALGALGADTAIRDRETGRGLAPGSDELFAAPLPHTRTYEAHVQGQESGCVVALRGEPSARGGSLELGPACKKFREVLSSEVRSWLRTDDGDILFLAEDGRPVAQFYPGDGVSYESLRPALPLMALTEP
jgi:hypothetical protein